jgi:hypothetical protein
VQSSAVRADSDAALRDGGLRYANPPYEALGKIVDLLEEHALISF